MWVWRRLDVIEFDRRGFLRTSGFPGYMPGAVPRCPSKMPLTSTPARIPGTSFGAALSGKCSLPSPRGTGRNTTGRPRRTGSERAGNRSFFPKPCFRLVLFPKSWDIVPLCFSQIMGPDAPVCEWNRRCSLLDLPDGFVFPYFF